MSWYQFVYWMRPQNSSGAWSELQPSEVLQLSGTEFWTKLQSALQAVDSWTASNTVDYPVMSWEACLIVMKWDPKTSTWRRYVG